MSTQETIFDRAYYWIDGKTERAGRWLDKNIGRILFATGAAGISAYGYQQSDGTFLNSISPELFGIVLTAVIIDYVNERRQEAERKKILIAQLGSSQRDVTELALIELTNRFWLYDGSLKRAYLVGANLRMADLARADLRGANLSFAAVKKARLELASLQEADLENAELEGASLDRADLSGANLAYSNFSGADLFRADLCGSLMRDTCLNEATLYETNLGKISSWTIEQLCKAKTLEGAIMPDGIRLMAKQMVVDGQVRKEPIEGPTFAEWKTQYLAKNGGTEGDLRGIE